MTLDPNKLRLGKGVRFVKSHLRRLAQQDDIWEADFLQALSNGRGVWRGLVIAHHERRPLYEQVLERPPTVNDMADLLSAAMLRPRDGEPRRPRILRIRKRREWQELLPHLEQIGIRVVSAPRLAKWDSAFKDCCRTARRPDGEATPHAIEESFPAVAQFVQYSGWIEIGDQQGIGFVARALDYGGLLFDSKRARTLGQALAALERGLAKLD